MMLRRPWLRMFRADPWVVVALAVLTFLASLTATAVPRAMSTVADRQLQHIVASLASYEREPQARWTHDLPPRQWADPVPVNPWEALESGAEEVRRSRPSPLRELLLPAQFLSRTSLPVSHTPDFESSGLFRVNVHPVLTPSLQTAMSLVEGRWPSGSSRPYEVVLAEDVAERLGVDVGAPLGEHFLLVGTVRPTDPDDSRWELFDTGDRLSISVDPNLGEEATVTAYLDPGFEGSLFEQASTQWVDWLWYPVDVTRLQGHVDVAELERQLTSLLSARHTLVDAESAPDGLSVDVQFESVLGTALQRVAKEQRAATTLVAIVAAGPVGVAAAVLWLGAGLVVVRRRNHLELMTARGASPEQLRTMIGLEGAVLGLPAAVAGHLVALAVDGVSPWWLWLTTLLVGLAPAAALALALRRPPGRRARSDLSARGTRVRLAAEVGVLALAVAATWQLLTQQGSADDIDLLAVATPVLIALAAVLLTVRLYPLPLAAITAAAKRGRSLTAFLGSARALRDPVGGVVPTLAIVLGASMTMLSAVMLGTVTRGAEEAVWNGNGAAARLSGGITDEVMARIVEVDGVTAAGRLSQSTTDQPLAADGGTESVRVWIVEDTMAEVWAQSPQVEAPPRSLFDGGAVVTGGDVAARSGTANLGGVGEVRIVGHLDRLPGTVTTSRWVLVSASTWESAGGRVPASGLAFVAAEPGADLDAVGRELEGLVLHGRASTVGAGLARNAESVVVRALTTTFVAAAATTGLLTALAIVVVQLMGSRSRAELLAVLRTQGLGRGQARGLVAWELAPVAAAALVVGAGVGIGIGALLTRTLDLTGLTGDTRPPALFVDPAVLGGVLLALFLTVTSAVTVSAWLAGRTDLAQALRIGDER